MWLGPGYVSVLVLGIAVIVLANVLAYLAVRDMGANSPVSHEPIVTLRGGFLLLLAVGTLFLGTGIVFLARSLFSPY
ncbi:MAG TPA: hypothetical protein VKZ59_09315 [Acidobacteriota bacterium]|nr:hypothetical protein [Acidobacteriota bacterium]